MSVFKGSIVTMHWKYVIGPETEVMDNESIHSLL